MTPEEACNFPLDLENHYGYIYCITFPNNKRYIGQCTRPWKSRWAGHKCGHCVALRSALYKYPIEQVTWEVLEYAADRAALDSLEQFYIQKFGSLVPHGYNLTAGGQNIPISILVTKPVLTKAEKQGIKRTRLLMEQLKNFEDTGFNIISFLSAQRGQQCISAGQLKSALYSESIYSDPVKAAEMKEKLSQVQQALHSHPVHCVELNETFSSPTDAVKKHPEWNKTKINACCIGTDSTHHGLHFYHPDDPPEKLAKLKQKWEDVASGKIKYL